jgi:hypothetical protein
MKKLLIPVLMMLLAGCDYEVLLSQTPCAPANPDLAGSWLQQKTDDQVATLEIHVSGENYLVTYEGHCFKGFEIQVGGLNLIQLEWQNKDPDTESVYLFVKYELTPDGLTYSRLNPEVVSAHCQTSAELLADLFVHWNNPSLFTNPEHFVRSVSQ